MCIYLVCTLVGLVLLPGAPVVQSLIGFGCVTLVVTATYRRVRSYHPAGEYALFAAALIMTLGIVANTYYFTTVSGGTCSSPVLQNFDSNQIWNDINAHYGIGDGYTASRALFGTFNAALMHLFGHSIVVLLIANMFMLLSALLVGSLVAHNLTGDRRTSGVALCASAAVCYLLTMGTLLLRDAWIIFAMALAAYGLTKQSRYNWIYTLVGAALIASIRPNWTFTIILGIVLMTFAKSSAQRNYLRALALCLAVFALWLVPTLCAISPTLEGCFDPEVLNQYYKFDYPQHNAYYSLLGNYYDFPLYKKILHLPITLIVQFFIPLPWNFTRYLNFGYTEAMAQFAYPWYVFGGLLLYYLCFVLRSADRRMQIITLWAMLCWAIPCVLYGGTVSRYALPMVILFAPCVAVVITKHLRERTFMRFAVCYAVMIGIALPTLYILQMAFYR